MTLTAAEKKTIAKLVSERGSWLTYYHDTQAVRDFPLADDDLIIAGYPKSGTNWIQVVLASLWDGWGTCAITERGQVPNLSGANDVPGYAGFDICMKAQSPRLMKVHFAREFMPGRWPQHGKVIHVMRNPKDVVVSNYHELKDSVGLTEDFDSYFDRWLDNDLSPYSPYLSNNQSWRDFEHQNLLKITYEEVRKDVRPALKRIIEFVGRPVSEKRLDEVIAKTSFDAMKKNELRLQVNHFRFDDEEKPFLRKGAVGGWKGKLTAEQAERVEREVIRPMGASAAQYL